MRKQAKETGNRDQKLIKILIEEKRNFMKIMSKTNKYFLLIILGRSIYIINYFMISFLTITC